uniref:Uncharacterized protein n=1 Tax=Candidatus Kentrum sp. FM TaxID=2126340 RepID=A0A450S3Q0_9GAMM|nr:MAG: hypothetical protein BECKFM1743C_GA0114222_100364 [Candidatus Kentron sp. FM]VFJ54367.1 MAG: hypothetical protein BECKFM1743A_GA0114220_101304 [Candidatus Kentron sp. FM]VFK10043.1 MAG: hypothetical protein BECKFM1743B_GA0114221_101273 [Candidatus Kentron sp. FM]
MYATTDFFKKNFVHEKHSAAEPQPMENVKFKESFSSLCVSAPLRFNPLFPNTTQRIYNRRDAERRERNLFRDFRGPSFLLFFVVPIFGCGSPRHVSSCPDLYMDSGAWTPRMANPFFSTWRVAMARARRALRRVSSSTRKV